MPVVWQRQVGGEAIDFRLNFQGGAFPERELRTKGRLRVEAVTPAVRRLCHLTREESRH